MAPPGVVIQSLGLLGHPAHEGKGLAKIVKPEALAQGGTGGMGGPAALVGSLRHVQEGMVSHGWLRLAAVASGPGFHGGPGRSDCAAAPAPWPSSPGVGAPARPLRERRGTASDGAARGAS